MIGLKVKIVTDEETFTVPITPRAAINFERHFKIGLVKAFSQDQKMEHLYWVGWECTRLSGKVVKPFDGWLDTVSLVEFLFEPVEPFQGKDQTTPTSD